MCVMSHCSFHITYDDRSRSRKLGSDSSPYRSISAGEESDSEGEDENMKPRGKHIQTTIFRWQ